MENHTLEIDLSRFREIINMKKEAEEFLKSHSEQTEKVRDKQNIVMNCDFVLNAEPLSNYINIEDCLNDIESLDGPLTCRGCTLDDCRGCGEEMS